jgi:hypothetical protein
MDSPDFGTMIIRLSLAGVIVILVYDGQGQVAALLAAALVIWIGAPYARARMIRLRQRGLQRRGDGWMADAARAKTTAWREHCQAEARRAYDAAASWERVK